MMNQETIRSTPATAHPEIGSSRTQFMKRLVEFSDCHPLTLELAYYPPYHSKYNRIERCWGILENQMR